MNYPVLWRGPRAVSLTPSHLLERIIRVLTQWPLTDGRAEGVNSFESLLYRWVDALLDTKRLETAGHELLRLSSI